MIDQATFSANRESAIHPNSELKHEMTFDTGLPFDKLIAVLDKVPTGFNYIIVSPLPWYGRTNLLTDACTGGLLVLHLYNRT